MSSKDTDCTSNTQHLEKDRFCEIFCLEKKRWEKKQLRKWIDPRNRFEPIWWVVGTQEGYTREQLFELIDSFRLRKVQEAPADAPQATSTPADVKVFHIKMDSYGQPFDHKLLFFRGESEFIGAFPVSGCTLEQARSTARAIATKLPGVRGVVGKRSKEMHCRPFTPTISIHARYMQEAKIIGEQIAQLIGFEGVVKIQNLGNVLQNKQAAAGRAKIRANQAA